MVLLNCDDELEVMSNLGSLRADVQRLWNRPEDDCYIIGGLESFSEVSDEAGSGEVALPLVAVGCGGDVGVFSIDALSNSLHKQLVACENGHQDIVRGFVGFSMSAVVSCGEDGRVCQWSTGIQSDGPTEAKLEKRRKRGRKVSRPY